MKKRLALKFDNKNRQSDEINKVISTLKNDFIDDASANKIRERLNNSLKNGCLNLSCCKISDEILNEILPLLSVLNITSLYLGSNRIGTEGAKTLAKALEENKSITTLDLSWNNIGPEGAKVLAKTLKQNKSIKELYLGCNQIGDEGAIALAEALKINISLTYINLYSNNLGDELTTKIEKEIDINNEIAAANKRLISRKYHLIWILNSKSETNIAIHIVLIIADFLLSDFISNEAARKILNKSGSRQQQPAQLAADQSSSSGEPTLKKP